ncbi:MAG: alcohol dehydrogenase, partial [candidate division WOR-3 bacterium]
MEKKIMASFMGSTNPERDIPLIIRLYRERRLDLASLVSSIRKFEDVNEALQLAQEAGMLRIVLTFEP